MSKQLVKQASATISNDKKWSEFLTSVDDIIDNVNEWRADMIKNQTSLDILSGKILDFNELMDILDEHKTIARYIARAMEHRLKKARGQAIEDAILAKKTATYAKEVSKYTETDDAHSAYNDAQLVADRLQGSWDVAKETISSARSKLSYEKEVARNIG